MTGSTNIAGSSLSQARGSRWASLRDLLGGALLLAAWLALWTVTWAAVAGPLRPADPVRAEVVGQVAGA